MQIAIIAPGSRGDVEPYLALAQDSSTQAATLEETTAAMEEISSHTDRTVDNTRRTRELVSTARAGAARGAVRGRPRASSSGARPGPSRRRTVVSGSDATTARMRRSALRSSTNPAATTVRYPARSPAERRSATARIRDERVESPEAASAGYSAS